MFPGWTPEQIRKAQERSPAKKACDMACGPGDYYEGLGCLCDRLALWNAAERKGLAARTEEELHDAVLEYLRARYPWLWRSVHSDLSGFRLGIKAQARLGRLKQSRGFPDILILFSRGGYSGLALELKKQGARVWLKSGELSSDIHIREQAEWLGRFRGSGFFATFVIGFADARAKIDRYIQGSLAREKGPDPPGAGL